MEINGKKVVNQENKWKKVVDQNKLCFHLDRFDCDYFIEFFKIKIFIFISNFCFELH